MKAKDEGSDDVTGLEGLSTEESNNMRMQALNALGVGVNGVNDALIIIMLERLLGDVATRQVKDQHQMWLADQLTDMEEMVKQQQEAHAQMMRKQKLVQP